MALAPSGRRVGFATEPCHDFRFASISGQVLTAASGWRSESYTYDDTGNRSGGGYTTATGNRTTSDGTFNYDYDDEGNLTKKSRISNGEYTEYTWDHRNRLTSVVKKNSSHTVLQSSDYVYDVFDKRIKLVDNVGTSQTRWTTYDGLNTYADFDGSGALTKRYLSGRAIDSVLARWTPSDDFNWYLGDMLGTIRDIADKNAVIQDHITYDSFGNVLSESNASYGDRFRYTGREYDAATGLHYYRARYYDSALGKFIGQDPIRFAAGDANLYRSVENSPTMLADPSGLYATNSQSKPPKVMPPYTGKDISDYLEQTKIGREYMELYEKNKKYIIMAVYHKLEHHYKDGTVSILYGLTSTNTTSNGKNFYTIRISNAGNRDALMAAITVIHEMEHVRQVERKEGQDREAKSREIEFKFLEELYKIEANREKIKRLLQTDDYKDFLVIQNGEMHRVQKEQDAQRKKSMEVFGSGTVNRQELQKTDYGTKEGSPTGIVIGGSSSKRSGLCKAISARCFSCGM